MDGTRFDQLIKNMATTRVTRLTALRGLAVGALTAAVGFAAPDEADARKKCNECQKKKKHRSNNGKVRIRCKAKANGTLCSIGTCQNSVCTRAVVGCTGTNNVPNTQGSCPAGQLCNSVNNCVAGCT